VREIIRLALTLFIIGLTSAALLTGVNNWTGPIIEERRKSDYLETIASYFPDVESFETKAEENGDSFDLIYDSAGNLLGVMGTIRQGGYGGVITYNLAIDTEGVILGLRIISHSETPGIGDVITRESFLAQFIGKSHEDPFEPGEDVDLVSGATESTGSILGSVRRSVSHMATSYLDFQAEIFDITKVPDGAYQGAAAGGQGEIVVEVVVEGGRLVKIEVLEQKETPTMFVLSYPLIPERMIAEQKLEVDTSTGATASAEGIVNAVRNALKKAIEEGEGEQR